MNRGLIRPTESAIWMVVATILITPFAAAQSGSSAAQSGSSAAQSGCPTPAQMKEMVYFCPKGCSCENVKSGSGTIPSTSAGTSNATSAPTSPIPAGCYPNDVRPGPAYICPSSGSSPKGGNSINSTAGALNSIPTTLDAPVTPTDTDQYSPPIINEPPQPLVDADAFSSVANKNSDKGTISKAMDDIFSDPGNPSSTHAMTDAREAAKKFLEGAMEIWSDSKQLKELAEPFIRLQEALDMADVAATGRVPTTLGIIDKLRDYADKQANALEALARNSDKDWIKSSGINEFNRAGTVLNAQQFLDAWSQRLNSLQQLIQKVVPPLQVAQKVLDNDAVNGSRMALQGSEVGLDPFVMQEVINQLNYCSSKITAIQSDIHTARSANNVYYSPPH